MNRRRAIVSGAVVVGALVAALLPASAAHASGGYPPPSGPSAVVTVDLDSPISTLPDDFLGLSFEKSILSNSSLDPTSGNFAQLMSTVADGGHLRFGGNQMDAGTWWQPGGQPVPAWAQWVVDRSRVDALADLAARTGWDVEMGVNLRNFDQASTLDEAQYLDEALGDQLVGIACGNEIDLFPGGRDWNAQRASWQACADTVSPSAALIGGEEADGLRPAMLDTVGDQLSLASSHFYAQYENCFPGDGPDGRQPFELESLLTPETRQRTIDRLAQQVSLADGAGLPFRLTESNSAACLRQENIGNVYAAALWSVDHLLLSGSLGVTGVNMHVPFDAWHPCSRLVTYSPFCAATPEAAAANELTINPVYYGMLTVGQVDPGDFVSAEVTSDTNTTAYAIRADDGSLQVVIVQKDAPGGAPVEVTIPGITGHGPARTTQLAAPSLTSSTADITLQGAQVQADGTFQKGEEGTVPAGSDGYTLTVPTGSATIVTIDCPEPHHH